MSLTRRAAIATALSAPMLSVRAQTVPIRIGFPTPLTGAFGAEAQDQVRAAQLAIMQFNESGGLQGRAVGNPRHGTILCEVRMVRRADHGAH